MKVLWLVSWYPSKLDYFNGDFIRRHAEAVSLEHDVEVIYVVKDRNGSITDNHKTEKQTKGRLTEQVIYYHSSFQSIPLVSKFFSEVTYRRLYKRAIRKYIESQGKPNLVHLHVCIKAGTLAMWAKAKYGLPYLVTEHSSLFLKEASAKAENSNFYLRKYLKLVLQKAVALSVVSKYLGESIGPYSKGKTYSIIPNVVNANIFKPVPKADKDEIRFIHISGLGAEKNPMAILDAFDLVRLQCQNFRLDIVGGKNEAVMEKAKMLGLENFITFYGAVPQEELSLFLNKSHALVLFSHYETFGCVVIEANACGLPVIVSDIPAMKEIVEHGVNGLLVKENDSSALAKVLTAFVQGFYKFNAADIASSCTAKFNYEKVANLFSSWYSNALQASEVSARQ